MYFRKYPARPRNCRTALLMDRIASTKASVEVCPDGAELLDRGAASHVTSLRPTADRLDRADGGGDPGGVPGKDPAPADSG